MKKSFFVVPLLLIAGIYFFTAWRNTDSGNHSDKKFNYQFTIKDVSGNKVAFDSYKGKVIFLNLWATWCGPCRQEMPGIQQLHNSFSTNEDIQFVMLSLDREGEERKVDTYIKSSKYTFPVFMPHGQLPSMLNVPSIPTTFIIDKDGRVALRHVGSENYNTEKYKDLLKELASR